MEKENRDALKQKITVSVEGRIELSDTETVKVWVFDSIHYSLSFDEILQLLHWLYEQTGSPVIDTALYLIWRKELGEKDKEKVRKIRTLYLAFLDGKITPTLNISEVYSSLVEAHYNSTVYDAMKWLYTKTGADTLLEAYNRIVSYNLGDNERQYIMIIEDLLFKHSNIHYCEEIYRKVKTP